MEEKWKPVKGFEAWYEVSDQGRVRRSAPGKNTFPGRILNPVQVGKYLRVTLSLLGERHLRMVHRLVAEAFIADHPEGKNLVLHWDDDGTNNSVENLRWGGDAENSADAVRNGIHPTGGKTYCVRGHELKGYNVATKSGVRKCKKCKKVWSREFLQKVQDDGGIPEQHPAHGTRNGYNNYGCRCGPCRKANSEHVRKIYLRKKGSSS